MKRKKNYNQKISFLIFIVINSIVLFYLARSLNYFHSDAQREQIFHDDQALAKQYVPENVWANLTNRDSIILNPLKKDYLDFWYSKSLMEKNQDSIEIIELAENHTHKYITASLLNNAKEKLRTEQVIYSHKPTIKFFAADGKTAIIEDSAQESIQFQYVGKKLISKKLLQNTYQSIWVFRDGLWKMRQLELMNSELKNVEPIEQPIFFTVKNGIIYKNDEQIILKGTNYYPQEQAWENIWADYKPEIIEKDLQLMQESGLNCIRVFIPYSKMGAEQVNGKYIQNFISFLDLCKKYNLYVIPTLFDFFSEYNYSRYTFTDRYLQSIVSATKEHTNILAWDIKNEPDLDFKLYGKENVMHWLEFTALRLKELDPNHFITIGWSNAKYTPILKDRVNLISFHFYEKTEDFAKEYSKIEKENPTKPIVITEFGYSSYEAFWFPMSHNEYQQALYYKNMFKEMEKVNAKNFLHWTLYDFPKVPDEVVGSIPWRKKVQEHYGFIDKYGHKKPAFAYINGNIHAENKIISFQLFNQFHLSFIIVLILFIVLIYTVIKNPKYFLGLKLILRISKRILK